jgi:hypothetical protein
MVSTGRTQMCILYPTEQGCAGHNSGLGEKQFNGHPPASTVLSRITI